MPYRNILLRPAPCFYRSAGNAEVQLPDGSGSSVVGPPPEAQSPPNTGYRFVFNHYDSKTNT